MTSSTQASATHRRAVTKAAALTAVGGILFGYDTGVIGGVLPNISDDFTLDTPFLQGTVVSILLVGAAVGALVAGRVADTLGRRRAIIATSLVFVVGLLLSIVAPAFWVLLLSRFLIGVGVGSASFVVPVYIGEIAPPERRGALVSLNQLSVTLGILVSQLVAYFLAGSGDWRISVGLALAPAVVLGLGMIREPESPAWLVRQGRDDEAREVLRTLRDSEEAITAEIDDIRGTATEEEKGQKRSLLAPKLRPALVLGVTLAVVQQITGVNTVIYFAPTVLENAGLGAQAALLALLVVGLTNVVMTVVAIKLIDRVGRRALLVWGMSGMTLGLVGLAVAFLFDIAGAGAIATTVVLAFYVGSFAVSLGPVVWLLISEIFPLAVRGRASSVATMANWVANFAVAVSYLSIIAAIGETATFGVYAAITVLSLVYVVKAVPETKNRSLADIERELSPAS